MTDDAPSPTRLSLLMVEDSPDDAELVVRELRREGLLPDVVRVETGAEMEAALRARAWDVISTDYQLPGFDTLGALALRAALAPDTPVIVVSGYIGETAAVTLLKAGADDYIPKNNLARLTPALRRAMRDAAERRARRQAEDERARLIELREEFLVLASHELRTPLTALRFQVENASRASGDNSEVRHKLGRVEALVDRMARLVSDMIVVSKVHPVEPLCLEEVDVGRLVTEAVAELAREERTDAITTQVPPDPVAACLDRSQVTEALRRLSSNAIRFGAGQPVDVRLTADDAELRLAVTDRGVGVAPEHHHRIFERFERAASVRNYGGLGLGLWIARAIVEAHDGRIEVDSDLGRGAIFTIVLPRRWEAQGPRPTAR